jgi:hypothetical protein
VIDVIDDVAFVFIESVEVERTMSRNAMVDELRAERLSVDHGDVDASAHSTVSVEPPPPVSSASQPKRPFDHVSTLFDVQFRSIAPKNDEVVAVSSVAYDDDA